MEIAPAPEEEEDLSGSETQQKGLRATLEQFYISDLAGTNPRRILAIDDRRGGDAHSADSRRYVIARTRRHRSAIVATRLRSLRRAPPPSPRRSAADHLPSHRLGPPPAPIARSTTASDSQFQVGSLVVAQKQELSTVFKCT